MVYLSMIYRTYSTLAYLSNPTVRVSLATTRQPNHPCSRKQTTVQMHNQAPDWENFASAVLRGLGISHTILRPRLRVKYNRERGISGSVLIQPLNILNC